MDEKAPTSRELAANQAIVLRFGVFFLLGFGLLTGLVWGVAMQGWQPPDWFYSDFTFNAAAVVIAIIAAISAQLRRWWQVVVATVIACVLHFMLFLLPPILLIGYPYSSLLVRDITHAMEPLLVAYAIGLALTFLVQSLFQKSQKGQT